MRSRNTSRTKSTEPNTHPAPATRLTDHDLYLFNEGSHFRLYKHLGAHPVENDSGAGTYFAVWAPDATQVAVMGDFSDWKPSRSLLRQRGVSGIWEGMVPEAHIGDYYKYQITSRFGGQCFEKADPFAFAAEIPPKTASQICTLDYAWQDAGWMNARQDRQRRDAPISIYEVHLGSWWHVPEEGDRSLSYRELAPKLAEYVKQLGFTHVEFLPVMEHPFYGSWGYQTTGYFAPTSRYGTPQDFMYLIDTLHQHGIGVILDWVPSHFPNDPHGLATFDGSHLYEHADPKEGFHPDWKSYIFNYGRHEVQSFLISSALFWLDHYHVDGLRVDAVASMLYRDYSRKAGEWIPNQYGGRENLEAVRFLRRLNEAIYINYPDVQTVAEESTAWPMVSRPTYLGGLGFGFKWDMGWMHDTLLYISHQPVHRKYHHNEITFRMLYAFTENYILPLSHDEVVHGKGSLLGKMPGDDWQKFANLRLLFGYQYAQPGKKLLFMGSEFGQWSEWNHDASLEWHLMQYERHQGIAKWVTALNRCYRQEPALYAYDCEPSGFKWIDASDAEQSVLTFLRTGKTAEDLVVIICNFTPVTREGYRIGVPLSGRWKEILNSDAKLFGGSGQENGELLAEGRSWHGQPYSLNMTLAPLAMMVFKPQMASHD